MVFSFKRLFFSLIYNFLLFSVLVIGMQNSSDKKKVNLLSAESIPLPVSFIIGISFITGTFIGSSVNFNNFDKQKKNL